MKKYLLEILPADGLPVTLADAPPETPHRSTPQETVRPSLESSRRTVLNEHRGFKAGVATLMRQIRDLRGQIAYQKALADVDRATPARMPTPKPDPAVAQARTAEANMRYLAGVTDLIGFAQDTEHAEGGDRTFCQGAAGELTAAQRAAQVAAGIRPIEQFSK